MVRFFAVLISFFLFFRSSTVAPYEVRDAAALKFSAVLLSDMHTEANSAARFHMIGETFAGVFAGGNKPDVLAFAGDNTMNGNASEWFDFYGLLGRFNRGSDVLVAMGNHDFGNCDDPETYARLSERAIASYNYYCRKQIKAVYYAADYGCVKFLILGSEGNAPHTLQILSDGQIDWLEAELSDCAARGIPAVVVNHNLIRGRTGRQSYFSFNLTDNNDRLDDALTGSGATVLYVCGHSHFGVSSGSWSSAGKVTYINLPSAGNHGNYDAADDCAAYGIGLLLELYDGTLELSFRNFAAGSALEVDRITVPLRPAASN
ncbi:MAG: metallophosphoesterase [Clostridia bacterium]|nr:metallophosphoesterase [Clostridia bacterium]